MTKKQKLDWYGFIITSTSFALIAILYGLSNKNGATYFEPTTTFIVMILLLLAYRLAKETKTSWLQRP